MAKDLSPRIDQDLREVIDEIAHANSTSDGTDDWTIDETAKKLIEVGVVVRAVGKEPKIRGPLGLPRPFAEISLSKARTEIRTTVSDELVTELTTHFDNKPNTAAREALRLGVLTVAGNKFTVEGPAGCPRPFADITIEQADDADAHQVINELQQRITKIDL